MGRHLGSGARPLEERFWEKVDKSAGDEACWPWIAHVNRDGYGRILGGNRKVVEAHRVAYTLEVGPVPDGCDVDHQCHNENLSCQGGVCAHRRCVNPAHLRAVSRRDNLMSGRGGFRIRKGTGDLK